MGARVDDQSNSGIELFFSPQKWELFNSKNDSLGIKIAEAFALAMLTLTLLYPAIAAGYWFAKNCCCAPDNETVYRTNQHQNTQNAANSTLQTKQESNSTTSINDRTTGQVTCTISPQTNTPEHREDNTTQPMLPEWKVAPNVKNMLTTLFQDSPYSIDTLPVYSEALQESDERDDGLKYPHDLPQLEHMSAPVMKFLTTAGRPMLAIKLSTDNPKVERVFVLESERPGTTAPFVNTPAEHSWHEAVPNEGMENHPSFFGWGFLLGDGTLNATMHQAHFDNVHRLLCDGYATDKNGVTWSIHGYPHITSPETNSSSRNIQPQVNNHAPSIQKLNIWGLELYVPDPLPTTPPNILQAPIDLKNLITTLAKEMIPTESTRNCITHINTCIEQEEVATWLSKANQQEFTMAYACTIYEKHNRKIYAITVYNPNLYTYQPPKQSGSAQLDKLIDDCNERSGIQLSPYLIRRLAHCHKDSEITSIEFNLY